MAKLTLLSWNVNGVRAIHRKGFLTWLKDTAPDILCLQETKAMASQLPVELAQPEGYRAYWHSAERKGYSGTALITRQEPLSIQFGLGLEVDRRRGSRFRKRPAGWLGIQHSALYRSGQRARTGKRADGAPQGSRHDTPGRSGHSGV